VFTVSDTSDDVSTLNFCDVRFRTSYAVIIVTVNATAGSRCIVMLIIEYLFIIYSDLNLFS